MENQNDIHRELTSLPVGKLLWKYSVPAIVGTMVMSLYNVIDRIFIGQGVGADAISGLALTFPIMSLAGAIGMLVGLGASARISIVLGQNDKVKAEKILANSLVLSLSFAVCYLTFFSVYMDDILRSFGGSDRTIPYAREFLIYIMPGMLCTNLCYSFNNMMRASGYPGKAMYTMLIGAFSNLILAPIFIFWLDWGIKGAAIATDIAMAISAAFVMIHFFNPKSQLRFHRRYFKLEWGILFNIVSIGLAPFLVNVASSVINAIINTSLYRYGGDEAIGAFGIFNSYATLVVMLIIGLCQGMQPIVGYNYGAGNYARTKKAFVLTGIVATICCTAGWIGSTFFPYYIIRAFTTDTNLIDVAIHGMRIVMGVFPIVGFQIVTTNLFQSLGMASKSIFLSLTRQVIFLIPLLLIFPRIYALNGIWIAMPVSDTIATAITLLLLWRTDKKLQNKNTVITR